MAQTEWADRPNTADMREQYGAVVDMARQGGFHPPENGWTAELVVAHLLATTENFLAVGGGVKRGERPDCGDPEVVADDVLARRAAESGERLAAHADSLSDAEAATPVRFTVYHEGRQLVDEPRAWGRILAGQTS